MTQCPTVALAYPPLLLETLKAASLSEHVLQCTHLTHLILPHSGGAAGDFRQRGEVQVLLPTALGLRKGILLLSAGLTAVW